MTYKKIIKTSLILLSFIFLYFFYYYVPSQNKGAIEVSSSTIKNIQNKSGQANKNVFSNTEYKNQTSDGQIFTTKAKKSYITQNDPNYVHLVSPYSFTSLKKDGSLIEIFSRTGFFDKKTKITVYEENVIIKNKNYLVTANLAKHLLDKNLIIIDGNVIMKDLTLGLSHIMYCDTVEIDTISNNATAFMKSNKSQVVAKKFK